MTFWALLCLLEIAYLLSLLLNILHFQSYHTTVFLCHLVNKWLLKKRKSKKSHSTFFTLNTRFSSSKCLRHCFCCCRERGWLFSCGTLRRSCCRWYRAMVVGRESQSVQVWSVVCWYQCSAFNSGQTQGLVGGKYFVSW